jgi:hypothetical protein
MTTFVCCCPACLERESFFHAMTIAEIYDNVPQWVKEILEKYENKDLPECEWKYKEVSL